ncbi:unnamed protein product [Didymodactylos carnosus]|nr:unnamed protein product [Didymodactylos carnosus]CAF4262491.1 unnamed protein product [Didymodactylos carnosus]
MQSGGTWGLQAGQWTDDTSMALCLAASLIVKQGFDAYDQLVRYKWWYKDGYMSSIGKCFDIGQATHLAVIDFEKRQLNFAERFCQLKPRTIKSERDRDTMISQCDCVSVDFKLHFGSEDSAGNGPLMRLSKYELLDPKFYRAYYFSPPLHLDVINIAEGSYKKKNGYEDGIRGKGYVLDALEAALWAVWNDQDSFERGVLSVVNLGDDTDTTAAIYGQLAGALYRIEQIPKRWIQKLFQRDFIITMANWLYLGGEL